MEVERAEIPKTRFDLRNDPDLPPESIVIPISEDSSWPELSPVYDREDSTKGSTNPKSHSNPFPWSKSRSGSVRVAATNLNPTASTPIISLPTKIQRPGFIYCRRPPPIFPKWRNSGSKKSGLPECEPGSPKVSCIGKVLSEREREKRRRKKEERKDKEIDNNKAGCWNGFSAILHCAGGGSSSRRPTEECRRNLEDVRPSPEVEEVRPSPEKAEIEVEEVEVVVVVPPAIGAMKKFSSGRRAAQWGDDVVEASA
ncbi:hypothetical protein LUZ60_001771 [Juncus effusus]|nr:hypothetical protein LUZ60_001771 [Juncus effusus]